jgi:hypothetical protein
MASNQNGSSAPAFPVAQAATEGANEVLAAAATIDDTVFGEVPVTAALATAEKRRELEASKVIREPSLDARGAMVLAVWGIRRGTARWSLSRPLMLLYRSHSVAYLHVKLPLKKLRSFPTSPRRVRVKPVVVVRAE